MPKRILNGKIQIFLKIETLVVQMLPSRCPCLLGYNNLKYSSFSFNKANGGLKLRYFGIKTFFTHLEAKHE